MIKNTFAFNKSGIFASAETITGSVVAQSGTFYLMKSSGGFLTKSNLSTTSDTNVFSIKLSNIDHI